MTKRGEHAPEASATACRWCRRPIQRNERGRPRQFCGHSCRQRDFEARARAARHGIDEHEIVVARAELDQLRDGLYVLSCAIEDVDRDITPSSTAAELREALAWILAAARPLGQPIGGPSPQLAHNHSYVK